jgi:para-nitrobenzyl esterase
MADAAPLVSTTHGPVVGRRRRGALLYAGIPYAAPPTGERRFAPPAPPEPWSEPRDATRFGPAAPQLPGEGLTNAMAVAWDEDCLTLNVCTPAADDAGRPVMVWIHGGDYRHGTGATPWYDGTGFAVDGDIVVVTINYRLGVLGFAAVDGEPLSAVNGLLDQRAALDWVHHNIAAFGGDPGRITIAGESAGAFSVASQMVLPSGDATIRGAILQSGAGHHVLERAAADEAADRLHAELDIGRGDLAALRSLPAHDLLVAQQRVEAVASSFLGAAQSPFYPSVVEGLLPERPIDAMVAGAGHDIAVLAGTNADETALWGMQAVPAEKLERIIGRYVDDPVSLIDVYRQAMPEATAGQLALAISTDHTFAIPAVRLGEVRTAAVAPTWMYAFDWKSRAFGGALGACHALEIPFTFATLGAPGVDAFLGTDELPTALSAEMHGAWTAFIRHLHPGIGAWSPYDLVDRTVYRFAEGGSGPVADPDAARRVAWDGLR